MLLPRLFFRQAARTAWCGQPQPVVAAGLLADASAARVGAARGPGAPCALSQGRAPVVCGLLRQPSPTARLPHALPQGAACAEVPPPAHGLAARMMVHQAPLVPHGVPQGHTDEVLDVAFDSTGTKFVSASADGSARWACSAVLRYNHAARNDDAMLYGAQRVAASAYRACCQVSQHPGRQALLGASSAQEVRLYGDHLRFRRPERVVSARVHVEVCERELASSQNLTALHSLPPSAALSRPSLPRTALLRRCPAPPAGCTTP